MSWSINALHCELAGGLCLILGDDAMYHLMHALLFTVAWGSFQLKYFSINASNKYITELENSLDAIHPITELFGRL